MNFQDLTLFQKLTGVLIVITFTTLMVMWTDSNLDFWFSYFSGSEKDVPLWIIIVIVMLTNIAVIPLNIISELIELLVYFL